MTVLTGELMTPLLIARHPWRLQLGDLLTPIPLPSGNRPGGRHPHDRSRELSVNGTSVVTVRLHRTRPCAPGGPGQRRVAELASHGCLQVVRVGGVLHLAPRPGRPLRSLASHGKQ